jgi:hydroxymethylpyrimidine/phosphomethylpyrimidine kinase
MRPPVVLVVAGLDPCGLSGVAADLRALAALGVHGAPVLSALTDQDGRGVRAVRPVDAELVAAQLSSVLGELPVAAVKVGLIASADVARALARALAARPELPAVIDPVLASSSGGELARAELVRELAARAHVLTPNLDEAAVLLERGLDVVRDDPRAAARALLELGSRAVLLKGGHGAGDAAVDLWADAAGVRELALPRVETRNDRGTGCALASALAAGLARGLSGFDAAWAAKRFVHAALERGRAVRWPHGRGPLAVQP